MATASGIHAGLLHELDGLLGVRVGATLGVGTALFAVVVLRADERAELALDDAVVLVGVLHDLAADLDVLSKGSSRGVDHDAGEALVDALLAQLEAVAVVEMRPRSECRREADGGLDELPEIDRIGVVAAPLEIWSITGAFFLFAGFNDRLDEPMLFTLKAPACL
jgi:hypothetical protein